MRCGEWYLRVVVTSQTVPKLIARPCSFGRSDDDWIFDYEYTEDDANAFSTFSYSDF